MQEKTKRAQEPTVAEVAPNGEPKSYFDLLLEKYLVDIKPDGKKALNFAPEDYDDLALVPMPVMTRLIKALSEVNVREYKQQLMYKIERAVTYNEIQGILEDEYIFNLTVRRVDQFDGASKEQRQSAEREA